MKQPVPKTVVAAVREIERLRALNARLIRTLEYFVDEQHIDNCDWRTIDALRLISEAQKIPRHLPSVFAYGVDARKPLDETV